MIELTPQFIITSLFMPTIGASLAKFFLYINDIGSNKIFIAIVLFMLVFLSADILSVFLLIVWNTKSSLIYGLLYLVGFAYVFRK